MTVLSKAALYLDYIRRFDSVQLFHLIKYKFPFNPFIKKISNFEKEKYLIDNTSYQEFKFNLNLLFKINETEDVFINEHLVGSFIIDSYLNNVLTSVAKLNTIDDINTNLWQSYDESDVEIQNNFYRFHLFSDVFNKLEISSDIRKNILLRWIDFNLSDIHLASNSFNCTLRILNWIKILRNIDENELTSEEWIKIKSSILVHASYIYNTIEHHIPGNHVFIQYYVLWLVSNLFCKWTNSESISSSTESLLTDEVATQFLEDGLHFELSTHYHIQITQFLLLWIIGLRNLNREIPDNVKAKAIKSLKVLDKFIFSDGTIPIIGDKCFTFIHSSLLSDIKNIKRIKDHIFDDLELKEESKYIFDIDQQYVISRINESKVIFDVGELGYPPNPGHGHSDLLNIIYSDRVPVFIDAGTRRYTDKEEDLLYKKAISHNTISINNKDHALLWGFFRWSFLPQKGTFKFSKSTNSHIIEAQVNWSKSIENIKHKRVINHSETELTISDIIEGNESPDASLNFILNPHIKCIIDKNELILTTEKYKWICSFQSDEFFKFEIVPFTVYPQYNLPLPSNKVIINFNKVNLPLSLRSKIIRVR